MLRRFRKRRLRREVGREIPWYWETSMTRTEKIMWHNYGWRVEYWVCVDCGAKREGYPMWLIFGGWMQPASTCEHQ